MTSILLLLALVLAAVLAAVLLGRELVGWTWEQNPAPGPLADPAYWRVRGPDGRDLAITEEQVEYAADRAKRIGWR